MKLIIAGATSLLGTEIVRQSLQIREITQVISLALQPVQLDKSIDTSKLKNVVIRDYSEYPDDVKAEFAGADACIWTVAVTPLHTGRVELKRVCQDYIKLGFEAICEAGPARPFRFMYLSVEGIPRDPTKIPVIMPDYHIMRCNTELMVLKFPTEKDGVEVCIARPGVIANSSAWSRALVANLFRIVNLFGRPPSEYTTESARSGSVTPGHGWVREGDTLECRTRSNWTKGAEISQYASAFMNYF
ncbi:hypothetical protein PENFLA_c044G03819 [Penicillium flavigenum]|uniref:NAD(P)-binding domain-containing protein n=1 Tax=Penicillium flavigenum TaxID=254877 RepID=A0A1V6SI24_9EURO|nr:hypothetical protein PENFLA_c044G03819 [Penicillium flavigenum]